MKKIEKHLNCVKVASSTFR